MAQDSFGSLAEIARIADAEEALATMVEVGWTTPSAVKQHSAEWSKLGLSKSQQAMLKATLDMWGARLERQPSRPGRSDLPQLKPATQGSLQRALDAAKPNQREEALKLFRADVFAKSNILPACSRLNTWQKIATAWGEPPWPLTPSLIEKAGASFKAGGYKSTKIYFAAATRQHTLLHGEVPAEVKLAIRDAVRSVERGLGGPSLKDSFPLTCLRPLFTAPDFKDFAQHYFMVILGAWFLTREIELAAALVKHVRFELPHKKVAWVLPMSKTDQRGNMIERSHVCACPADGSREPLCPYHAMQDLLDLREIAPTDAPLFDDGNGQVMTKEYSIQAIRGILHRAQIPLTRLGASNKQENRFSGHTLRIAGAQFLASHNVPLHTILLLGRWASRAVERYVQEAALHVPANPLAFSPANALPQPHGELSETAPQAKKAKVVPEVTQASAEEVRRVKEQLCSLAEQIKNINLPPPYVRGRKVHIPDPKEACLPPAEWFTKCGWNYGFARFFRSAETEPKCRKCFPEAKIAAEDSSSSETEQASTSSDSERAE